MLALTSERTFTPTPVLRHRQLDLAIAARRSVGPPDEGIPRLIPLGDARVTADEHPSPGA